DLPSHAWAFGEDQACYIVALPSKTTKIFLEEAKTAGVPAKAFGTTGGTELTVEGSAPISLARLVEAHEAWLPTYMAAQ
ncbi:phosphoribosylformylglycinamidine synthase II, partial [Parvibaculum lavamentivorans]|nr:phosphoribosylformylglycinamidine synthase II [Parvibaculum lavamentivorans]